MVVSVCMCVCVQPNDTEPHFGSFYMVVTVFPSHGSGGGWCSAVADLGIFEMKFLGATPTFHARRES